MSGAATGTFLDSIGGPDAAYALAHAFYDRVLADPLLIPLFRDPGEPHADRMAWWLVELFGGERVHSQRRGGFATMVAAHRQLGISEAQRSAWVGHMMAAADQVGFNERARRELSLYVEQASRLAMAGSRVSG